MPPPHWETSSYKHRVPREDQVYAMLNATFVDPIETEDNGDVIMLYIGPEHPQTDRELEILVRRPARTGAEASVFHAMPLGPKYRRYREDSQSD
ncbi:hypothetical protein [Leifsonia sp. NPDC077715]|uniref:hypothetical protein n=1 Tax=Leifsonia sp. NPDC077715 TaxID=3155539 RepID=UPI0034470776